MAETHRFETPGPVGFTIRARSADVTLETGTTGVSEVEVLALDDNERTLEAVAATRVESAGHGDSQVITVTVPDLRKRFGRGPHMRITILCPENADVDIGTSSGDVELRGPLGRVTLKTKSGDSQVERAQRLLCATASGDLDVREVTGDCEANGASGDVEIGTAHGRLSVHLVSGDVDIGSALSGITANVVSGDVHVRSLRGNAKVQAVSGDVRLGVEAGQRLWLDVSSISGDVSSELDAGDGAVPDQDATVAELKVRTVSGDVSLVRA